jgi:hypothetical protein
MKREILTVSDVTPCPTECLQGRLQLLCALFSLLSLWCTASAANTIEVVSQGLRNVSSHAHKKRERDRDGVSGGPQLFPLASVLLKLISTSTYILVVSLKFQCDMWVGGPAQ